MKKDKIIYWITTSIIFLWDSVLPAFTSNTQLAIDGIRHLGYPDYFRVILTVFKVVGGIVLIVPAFAPRFKEWAYVGFGLTFIFATLSSVAVDGFSLMIILPIVVFAILAVSYVYYHKLRNAVTQGSRVALG